MEEWDFLRFFAAFFAGALMSQAGSLIQGITQNDLAGPPTLGLDAAMVLLVLIAHGLKLWIFPHWPLSTELLALLFFMLLFSVSVGALHFFEKGRAKIYSNTSAQSVDVALIMGLSFNLFVGALFSLIHFFFMAVNLPFPSELWYGNFRTVPVLHLVLVGLAFVFIYGSTWSLRKSLRALSFGQDLAAGLLVPVARVQRQAMLLAFLATAVVDSLFGIFAFMGLIFTHLLRSHSFFSRHLGRELLLGPLVSGVVFAALDLLCAQVPFYGAEIPVGLVSGALGTLALCALLLKRWSKGR